MRTRNKYLACPFQAKQAPLMLGKANGICPDTPRARGQQRRTYMKRSPSDCPALFNTINVMPTERKHHQCTISCRTSPAGNERSDGKETKGDRAIKGGPYSKPPQNHYMMKNDPTRRMKRVATFTSWRRSLWLRLSASATSSRTGCIHPRLALKSN